MSHERDRFIAKYANGGVLIDTNLLLLLIVGQFKPERVTTFKATKAFDTTDLELLTLLVSSFTRIATTPHVLTEVNGFLNQMPEQERKDCLRYFGSVLVTYGEQWEAAANLADMDCFSWLGLTDCGIIDLAQDTYLVLTTDANLHYALLDRGIDSVNFNHLRMA